MKRPFVKTLYNIKQVLLVVSMVYFYALSVVILLKLPSGRFLSPTLLIVMGSAFVIGLALEGLITWWHKRFRIFFLTLIAIAYGLFGLVILPRVYGENIRPFMLAFPVVVVFVGGWVYVLSYLTWQTFFGRMDLSFEELHKALEHLPGWEYLTGGLEKSFHVDGFASAITFANRCGVLAQKFHLTPSLDVRRDHVKVRIANSAEDVGVNQQELDFAKEIDGM